MKRFFLLLLTGAVSPSMAQNTWTLINDSKAGHTGERTIVPVIYQVAHLETVAFKPHLFSAPAEQSVTLKDSRTFIELPVPGGKIETFRVVQSPVMGPGLAAKFPGIKTFSIQSVSNPSVSGKLDWTEFGLHAMLRSTKGDFFIDPYCRNNTSDYIVYKVEDFKKKKGSAYTEGKLLGTPQIEKSNSSSEEKDERSITCAGDQLRTYRLAVACTGEYAQAATGLSTPTTAQILSAVVTSVNRVDGVYETEVAVRLVLIDADTVLLFADPVTDPFTGNDDASVLIGESEDVIDAHIADGDYDIGHTFSTGGGGLAYLGCVCISNIKASGITGSSYPVGDPYDIDYVAHEMGHQFGGNHTFAAETGACDGNANPGTQVEPGSGITIMAYAGICSYNDLAPHSIPYFHAISFKEIMAYTTTGMGHNCPVVTSTGNHAPVVTAATTQIVPKGTPFILSGSATDVDGDSLTYQWEEIDNGPGGDWNSGDAPFFRSYAPVDSGQRMFPKLSVVLSGDYTGTIGEYLTSDPQILGFRLTVRDNKMGGGGVCSANTDVQIDNAGPFTVTYPNATGITWYSGSTQTVTWDVHGTNLSPVSCNNVNVLISLDGGNTFTTILSGTPNDGMQVITAPVVSVTSTTCRIKVESASHLFFDISDYNFTLSSMLAGMQEYANAISMQAVPNPFSNDITLNFSGIDKNEKTILMIHDVVGKVIISETITNRSELSKKYDLSGFEKGAYFVELCNPKQKAVTKLIKQ